jgi:hypothetical protein
MLDAQKIKRLFQKRAPLDALSLGRSVRPRRTAKPPYAREHDQGRAFPQDHTVRFAHPAGQFQYRKM